MQVPIIAVAPMMEYTDRHFRYLLRLISKDVRLYTEMIHCQAIIKGRKNNLLVFNPKEKYLALQLGGSNPKHLSEAAQIGESLGYDEINLNVGCPSKRVSAGKFGACLMLEPETVASCVAEMKSYTKIPITVKCRIGVDQKDSIGSLFQFTEMLQKAGCDLLIVHARKAWLSGLSPKENRDIPPLQYDVVWKLKQEFPTVPIIINGGLKTIDEMNEQLSYVNGVMIGRAICNNPFLLADIQNHYFNEKNNQNRYDVVKQFISYIDEQLSKGVNLKRLIRHLLCLFQGQPGAKAWRQYLTEQSHSTCNDIQIIDKALSFIKS